MAETNSRSPAAEDDRRSIPRAGGLDASLALFREGYRFISSRCDALGTDAFRTRLMLRPVVCMRGAEAARIFYGGARLTRNGAAPQSAMHLLQDEKSVQTLDAARHRARKAFFMRLADARSLDALCRHLEAALDAAAADWAARPQIVLHDALAPVLTRTAADFCGLGAEAAARPSLPHELSSMIENAGSIGPANWLARLRRRGTERWAADVMASRRDAGPASALPRDLAGELAMLRTEDGAPLPLEVAAVELLNILRPIVAVARFVVFGALALHEHPQWRAAIAADEGAADQFCAEVRRFFPFFPAVGGIVREPFEALGGAFEPGDWLLFDLYGTNHHPRLWESPEVFRPERFEPGAWSASPLVAQGTGDFATTHRCPGEHATMMLMRVALRRLAGRLSYRVPPQDLSVDLSRMPALPASGFVMADVRPA